MPLIKVTSKHLNQIRTQAEKLYPEECCGLLLGTIDKRIKIVLEVWPTENDWNPETFESFPAMAESDKPASKRNRFRIAPEVMLDAQKQARERQLDLIGIYHSHPDHSAVPSEFDRAIAWQLYSYIIVAVEEGNPTDIRSWLLDNNHHFQPEEIVTVMDNQSSSISN